MMQMNRLLASAALALAVSLTAASANASELIANGGFEDGFNGWDNQAGGWFLSGSAAGPATEGAQYASTGCVESYCTVEQTIATTVGATYDFSFAFNPGSDVENGGASTLAYFGATQVASVGTGPQGWTTYNFTGLTATSTTTNIRFTGYQDPAWNGLDAVSVTQAGGVPEPASWALMLTGFLGAGAVLRANRRQLAVAA
jgi:hypothetical protein